MNAQKENRQRTFTTYVTNVKNIASVLALIVAGYWGYTTFVYPEHYRPNDYRPHLSVESHVESIRILPEHAVISVTMQVSNHSKRFIRNLATYYEVIGRIGGYSRNEMDWKTITSTLDEYKFLIRHWDIFSRKRAEIVSVGRIVPDFWWFAPGEEYRNRVTFSVPRSTTVIEINTHAKYYHGNEDTFQVNWSTLKGKDELEHLSAAIKVKDSGEWVEFAYNPNDDTPLSQAHKELAIEYGLSYSVKMSEVDVPWSD